jgi:hypothetical protein
MKFIKQFAVLPADAEKIRALVEGRQSDWFVMDRQQRNVEGHAPRFNREEFWLILLGCLLTTQQRSTKGAPVDRFLELKPFPLSLSLCAREIEKQIVSILTSFGGIRRAPTIARQAKLNYDWLHRHGWASVEAHFTKLAAQRNRPPEPRDVKAEREAAYFADEAFAGIGPKQSRNLWQWLGLTRYEIPLDSRISKWIGSNLSIQIGGIDLNEQRDYDAVLDCIQALCIEARVLPCMFDAAAFDYQEQGSTQSGAPVDSKGTTRTGYVNPNGQVVIRDTGAPGTDKFQRVYQLGCSKCGYVYGANGSDCHLRLCPKCQDGSAGLLLR